MRYGQHEPYKWSSSDHVSCDAWAMRADRLVAALLMLQAKGRVTAEALAEELEVSVRTARRDLEALARAGLPVYAQPGRGGGWSLLGGARTDLSGLTAGETRALFLLAGPGGSLAPQARGALRKLVRALPETFRGRGPGSSFSRNAGRHPLGWHRLAVAAARRVAAARDHREATGPSRLRGPAPARVDAHRPPPRPGSQGLGLVPRGRDSRGSTDVPGRADSVGRRPRRARRPARRLRPRSDLGSDSGGGGAKPPARSRRGPRPRLRRCPAARTMGYRPHSPVRGRGPAPDDRARGRNAGDGRRATRRLGRAGRRHRPRRGAGTSRSDRRRARRAVRWRPSL